MRFMLSCVVVLALAGCSGSQKKEKKADDWDPMDSTGDDVAVSDSGSGDSGSGDSGSDDSGMGADGGDEAPAPKPKPPPGSDDYDLTYADCQSLAATYHGAWLAEEMKKLNAKKLKEKAFEKAKAQVEQSAEEAGENWRAACDSIVGSPFLYSRLKCAMKAKTVQRFDDCWDGKVQEE